jgi:guanylate kinase
MKNKVGSLIILSGPSGAGKGTIYKELLKRNDNLRVSISMTTRDPRVGEKDGVDYYFVTEEEYNKELENDAFLEHACVHGKHYGTLKREVDKHINAGYDVILEIDIQGALSIKNKNTDAIFIFIMPPSMRELKNRLIKRGTETQDKLIERFKNAYKEINEMPKYNYVVINDEVEKAVEKVEAIMIAERCRVDRIEEFDVNNQEELIHEILVDMKQ